MPNPTPILTLQFADIGFSNRSAFLAFIKKHIVEFALNRQELFLGQGYNAEYFHKDQQSSIEPVPVLIQPFINNGVLALRAYTKNAIDTLLFWQQLFKIENPAWCKNTVTSKENFIFSQLSKPIVYTSNNWIPFRDCKLKENNYYNIDKKADFQSTLIGNYRTLIQNLNIDEGNTKPNIEILKRSQHKSIIALKQKENAVKKYCFQIQFKIYVQMPLIFSLGQNVGYGNGVFKRI